MTRQTYLLPRSSCSYKPARRAFPWSGIILSFLMISAFLIFATIGTSGAETMTGWTGHVGAIIAGTALFSLAATLLVWAVRMMPKNI